MTSTRGARPTRRRVARSRSVICIAVRYATAVARDAAPLRGRVSNYAWSTDYHSELRSLLAGVAKAIDAAAGEPATAIACERSRLRSAPSQRVRVSAGSESTPISSRRTLDRSYSSAK